MHDVAGGVALCPEVADLPSKNRVWGFRTPARHRIKKSAAQASKSRQEIRLTLTTTASGLCEFTAKDPIDFAGGDTNLYAYVMNDPINLVDSTGLWGEDVHYGMTYSWAIAAGLTASQAERIARADNGTDGGFGSWMPLLGDQSRHFKQGGGSCSDTRSSWAEKEFQRAVGYYNAGNLDAALGHLGKGLHSLQDVDPHRNWDTGMLGWSAHPEWYDSWNDPRNSTARSMTEQRSVEYLSRFLSVMPSR